MVVANVIVLRAEEIEGCELGVFSLFDGRPLIMLFPVFLYIIQLNLKKTYSQYVSPIAETEDISHPVEPLPATPRRRSDEAGEEDCELSLDLAHPNHFIISKYCSVPISPSSPSSPSPNLPSAGIT